MPASGQRLSAARHLRRSPGPRLILCALLGVCGATQAADDVRPVRDVGGWMERVARAPEALGAQRAEFDFNGTRRGYLLAHAPVGPKGEPAPYIVTLHAAGSSGAATLAAGGFAQHARERRVTVLALEARTGAWSSDTAEAHGSASKDRRAELAFIDWAIADLRARGVIAEPPGAIAAWGDAATMGLVLQCRLPRHFGPALVVIGDAPDARAPCTDTPRPAKLASSGTSEPALRRDRIAERALDLLFPPTGRSTTRNSDRPASAMSAPPGP